MPFDPAAVARRLWAAVLVSNSLWVGFLAGLAGGSAFLAGEVPEAGGALVLWCGLAGALVAALMAALAIRRLDARRVRSLAIVALVIAAALASYIAWRASTGVW